MVFFRVVEVFPPLFRIEPKEPKIDLELKLEQFVKGVRNIRSYADLFLVASLKNPNLLKFSSIQAAALLQERAKVKAAPVIVTRDANRPQILSSILTSVGLGLHSLMLVWGDRYPGTSGVRNSYDFRSLSQVIAEARAIATRAGANARILAPITITNLKSRHGSKLASSRLKAGAYLLLAQPPTTDSLGTFDAHAGLLDAAGLRGSVLPCVFPFRGEDDVSKSEKYFGWKLPGRLHRLARSGKEALTTEAREVAKRLKLEGFPGVYLSTRGEPQMAKEILG